MSTEAGLAELCVLGSLMISGTRGDSDTIAEILSTVRGSDFLDSENLRYFEAARALYREGTPVDTVTVLSKLGLDRDEKARAHAAEIMDATPTTANWRQYAEDMRNDSILAQIQACAISIVNAHTLDGCREHVAAIESAFHSGHRIRSKTLEELYGEFAERQKPDAPVKPRYPLGIKTIDSKVKLSAGKFVMIGGLPSDGKTALALQWALGTAAIATTGVFSMETDDETVGDRIVTNTTGIDYDHIVDQRLTDLDWVKFAESMPAYARRNLRVFDESRLTVEQIRAVSIAYGLKVVFIDYGQLIETDRERGATRAELLSRVSIELKQFARENDVMVVVLLQLKEPKQVKGADGKLHAVAPTMEDLGETRQWMKDADVIFTLSRPDKAKEDNPYTDQLSYDKNRILKVAKNKEGKRGTVTLYFDGNHQRFYINGEQPEAKKRKKEPTGNQGQQTVAGFTELSEEEAQEMPF